MTLNTKKCLYEGNSTKKLCNNNKCEVCFNKSFASSDKANMWSSKNIKKPREVFKSSHKKYIFECDICDHEILLSLSDVTSGNWCYYCSNNNLCANLNCKLCHEKSFASSDKAIFWSKKNEKNPREVFKFSNYKYIFDCIICNHEFISELCNVSIGRWCLYCSCKKLCCNDDCIYCYNKSFASCDKSKFWSNKNIKNPRQVHKDSSLFFIFDCNVCLHEFSSRLHSIFSNSSWCPYCKNQKLCSNMDCKLCADKSFENSDKAKYWSIKNKDKPRNVFKNSGQKVIFDCPECVNEYTGIVICVTRGHWCNCIYRKSEKKLYKWLSKNNYIAICEAKFDWCVNLKTKRKLPFDFVVEKYKLIIELDGPQHFTQISNWQKPEITQMCDIYKIKKAIENEYSIIRLLQTDVLNDDNNWEEKLTNNIKCFCTPICIYIDNKNEYNVHKKLMEIDNYIDNRIQI